MFGGHSESGCSNAHILAIQVSLSKISGEWEEPRLSRNSQQCQNKIDQLFLRIRSLEAQSQNLSQLSDPKILVDAFSQAISSSLKIGQDNKSIWFFHHLKLYTAKGVNYNFALQFKTKRLQ